MTFDPMSVEVICVTLPKDHCVQVPWQYINVCGYSDQFCKIPHTYTYIHIHTAYILRTYYIHTTRTYYAQKEWSHSLLLNSVQARQKDPILHVATTFSLKQGETRTSHGPIPHPLRLVGCEVYMYSKVNALKNNLAYFKCQCYFGDPWTIH